ncbi:MAG TPA: MarR family transcriptional regulator [Verrucomicrobiae bacterium]|nr:MarR family transcriptional regulator [Verrucomicrobiae bacterium]
MDRDTLLAQELAQTMAQFWRVSRHRGSFQGIKQSEFMLLINLHHLTQQTGHGVRVSELSTQLNITSVAVTQLVNSLETKGFVERLNDPADRRVVLVKPTPSGEKLLERAKDRHVEHLRRLVKFLGEQDTKELIRIMTVMLDFPRENFDPQP